jgi:hypothetical protein
MSAVPLGRVLAATVAIFCAATAHSEETKYNVQYLLTSCRSPPGSTNEYFCMAFIGGIGDVMRINATYRMPGTKIDLVSMCGNPSHGAMIQAFKNWAETNPQEWAIPQSVGVITALRTAWPCQ